MMDFMQFTFNLCSGRKNPKSLPLFILSQFSRLNMLLDSCRASTLLVVAALGMILLYSWEDKYTNGEVDFNSPPGVEDEEIPTNLYAAFEESKKDLYEGRRYDSLDIILTRDSTKLFPRPCMGYCTLFLTGDFSPDNNLFFTSLLLRSPPKIFS